MSQDATDARARAKADRAYNKAVRPWYKKKRFILPAVVVLIAILSQLAGGGEEPTTVAAPSATASAATEGVASEATPTEDAVTEAVVAPTTEAAPVEEPVMEVTAQKMLEDLENNALGASNTYKDKRVAVTGKVANIDASGDYFSIRGDNEYSFINVQIDIEEEHLPIVSAFSVGQDVTVVGTVTMVGEVLGYGVDAETIS